MNSLWSIVIRKALLLRMHDVTHVSDLYTKKLKIQAEFPIHLI